MDAKRIRTFRFKFWGLVEALYLALPWLARLRFGMNRMSRNREFQSLRSSVSGDGKSLTWFVDVSSPDLNRDAGSRRLLEVMRDFQDKGLFIIFSSLSGDRLNNESANFLEQDFWQMPFESAKELFLKHASAYSIVWSSRLVSARCVRPVIKFKAKGCHFVYDTVDVHGRRIASYGQGASAGIFRFLGSRILKQELAMGRQFDVTIAVSLEENLWLESQGINSTLVPTIFDSKSNTNDWEERTGQFFVANFNHAPNVQGLTWYLSKVWPLLSPEVKRQGLSIVGESVPRFLFTWASEEIQFLGRVQELDVILQKARVSIAPILSGAGINGKIVEAMSRGVAVVTTSRGANGVGLTHNLNCLVADSAEDFASSVELLCNNKVANLEISKASEKLASERFSRVTLSESLDKLRG